MILGEPNYLKHNESFCACAICRIEMSFLVRTLLKTRNITKKWTLTLYLRHGVTWSSRWKQRAGSSKAVGRWAVRHCAADVGQCQPRLIWQHGINQPVPHKFYSRRYDSGSSIFTSPHLYRIHVWRMKHGIRMYQLYPCFSRCVKGARAQQAEETMGDGSSWETSESVGEGPAEQSLQHLFNTQRRSVNIWIHVNLI